MRQLNAAAEAVRYRRRLRLVAEHRRSPGVRIWRTLICCALFSLIFAPEFTRDGIGDASPLIYQKVIGGFRYVDVAILALAFLHVACLNCLRRKSLGLPRVLAVPGLSFLVCIAIAAAYGKAHGGTNVFFDWRALALGIALYAVWSFWMEGGNDVAAVVRLFAIYMAARLAILYLLYITGYRDMLMGVSIPVFDGPILSGIVCTALLAFSFRVAAPTRRQQVGWTCLAAGAALIIVLCLRRTYWAELVIGMVILMLMQKRHRIRHLAVMALVLAVATLALGSALPKRLQSFDLAQDDGQFSADNADHVHDLLDAWNEVRQSPLMGIGLGTSYPTWHIRRWKAESVMVHNAPLHVWLKYGLAGLVCYLWFHIALLRWLYRSARAPGAPHKPLFACVFAFLTAQFVVTLGFAPWPYSELQLTALSAFLLAAVITASRSQFVLRCA